MAVLKMEVVMGYCCWKFEAVFVAAGLLRSMVLDLAAFVVHLE